jgi:MoaA/NifB/PqqE/SkfB family radical SAM enzyme
MIERLHLALSVGCAANCVFCPSDRAENIKTKDMSVEVAKVCFENAKSLPNLKYISFSENGDCFLNKDVMEILSKSQFKFFLTLFQ